MPFDFHEVYEVCLISKNFLPEEDDMRALAMGTYASKEIEEAETYTYLVNSEWPSKWGRSVAGHIIEEKDDGTIVIEQFDYIGLDGKPLIWEFVPLSLERWKSYWATPEQAAVLSTRQQMLGFLYEDWVDDSWVDQWKRESSA
jgi:hypothetical protein